METMKMIIISGAMGLIMAGAFIYGLERQPDPYMTEQMKENQRLYIERSLEDERSIE